MTVNPKVYISYISSNAAEALELADVLREEGFDVRLDKWFDKSLHGFTRPTKGDDPWKDWQEEQIRIADSIILLCTHEYVESWRDWGNKNVTKRRHLWYGFEFMTKAASDSGKTPKQFVTVGFGPHYGNINCIPDSFHRRQYFDLTSISSYNALRKTIKQTYLENQKDKEKKHLVVLVNGINTKAQWMSAVKPKLDKHGFSVAATKLR